MLDLTLKPLDFYASIDNKWHQIHEPEPFNDTLYIVKECGDVIPIPNDVRTMRSEKLVNEAPEELV